MPRLPRLSEIPASVSQDELWTLIGRREDERVEFKESANRLREVIPAMAMTLGGMVVCGVSDARELVGCPMTQKTLDKIKRAAHEAGVEVQMRPLLVDGQELTLVAVPEVRRRIVTTADGRLLRRIGSENQPLRADALARFVREREERSGEDEPIAILDHEHIDLEVLNRTLSNDGRPPLRRRSVAAIDRALVDLGVAEVTDASLDPQPLRAAILLFAKQPTRYVPGASIQVVRRVGVGPGPGPVSARQELDGPIPVLLEKALRFIDAHTASRQAVIGTHRETLAEYPPAVLREAILNALAHRDYNLGGATVDLTIWDDRIDIQSPGALPGHITTENMRGEHYSRNRRIMRVLKLLGLVEEYGEGIDRMYSEMEARMMEPPHFLATASSVTVTLYNRSILSIEDQAWLALLGHLDLSAQERRVLVAARNDEGVTQRSVRALLGESADVEALIAGAVAKGLLVQVGHRGGARYVPSEEVIIRAGGAGVAARSRRRQTLLDELRRRGSFSTAEAADFLAEPDRTLVRQMLDDLVRARDAIAVGRTRGRRYHASGRDGGSPERRPDRR